MPELREIINDAEARNVAVGHFNVSNLEMFWGVFHAAQNLKVPVIIGVSEGERNFMGVRQVVALVRSVREEFNYPIFLNADHTYSFEKVAEAIDAGFDSVIFDGTKLPLDENIAETKRCVEYAKSESVAQGKEILIEGEIGYIGESSKILDEIPQGVGLSGDALTRPRELKNFVTATGIDLVAPAVGNVHGMLRGGIDPALDIDRIRELRREGAVSMVLHGGSGTSAHDFVSAIQAGISVVHVSTEIRVAYKKALSLSLQENPDEIAPYKLLKEPVLAVQKVVEDKLRLFNKL